MTLMTQRRRLGISDLLASPIGLGCMSLSGIYGAADDAESEKLIRRAHAVHPITAIQTEFSLLYRAEAEEARKTIRALNISFIGYSPSAPATRRAG